MLHSLKKPPNGYYSNGDIAATGQAITITLSRTAGLRWKYLQIDASASRRNELARTLLWLQYDAIESMRHTFYKYVPDPLGPPNGSTVWVFHMSGLTQRTMEWARCALFSSIKTGNGMSGAEQDSVLSLLENPGRLCGFVNDILEWQRKLCTCFSISAPVNCDNSGKATSDTVTCDKDRNEKNAKDTTRCETKRKRKDGTTSHRRQPKKAQYSSENSQPSV